jgi:hypothetical protein
MVVRAVLAVLTLLGAVPFRVCTCGAAHVHQKAPTPPAEHPSHPGCGGHRPNDPVPDHDDDCPAVKPRAAMPLAVTATVAELPADSLLVIAVDELPVGEALPKLRSAEPRSPDPPPGQPLYLTLRNFRN